MRSDSNNRHLRRKVKFLNVAGIGGTDKIFSNTGDNSCQKTSVTQHDSTHKRIQLQWVQPVDEDCGKEQREHASSGAAAALPFLGDFFKLGKYFKKLCGLFKRKPKLPPGLERARRFANNPNERKAFSYDPNTGERFYAPHHTPEMSQPGMIMGEYVNGDPIIYRGGSAAADDAAKQAVIRDIEQ